MTTPDATATARLIFDASSLRAGVQSSNQQLGSLYEVVRNNWWGIKNLGDAYAGVGATISAGLGVAISQAAQFEQGMAAVGRATYNNTQSADDNAEATRKLGEQLKDIALTKPVDLKNLTDIAAQAGALGVASQDVAQFTATIAELTSVTNLSNEDASKLARIAGIFNLTASQYANLGSAIYSTGVNTAATETEIVNMTTRLAPYAKAAGLGASETVGLAAAVLSLGPRSEAGATALQHLFGQFAKVAASADPTLLENYAKVAGVTADEFENLVKTDPSEALIKFANGLGASNKNAVESQALLDKLGISNVREIATLEALAAGTQNTANKNVQLANAIALANDAFNEGDALHKAAQTQYDTLNAQLAILKNTFQVVAVSIGDYFITPLKGVISITADTAYGLQRLPGPLKEIAAVSVGSIGGLAALAGVALLLAPRIILAAGAYQKFVEGIRVAITAQAAKVAADEAGAASSFAVGYQSIKRRAELAAESAELERNAAITALKNQTSAASVAILELQISLSEQQVAWMQAVNAGDTEQIALLEAKIVATEANIAATTANVAVLEGEAAALVVATTEMGAATVASTALGAAMAIATGPIGIAVLTIGLIIGATALFGHSQKESAQAARDDAKAQQDLTDAIERQSRGESGAVDKVLIHTLAMAGAAEQAKRFGFSLLDLVAIVEGQNPALAARFSDTIGAAAGAGDENAKKLGRTVVDLANNFAASAKAASAEAAATKDLGVANDATATSANDLADATNNAKTAADDQTRAGIQLVDALYQQREAAFNVKDAQDAYNKALADSKDPLRGVAQAERDLDRARISQREAAQSVKDAEHTLATARSDAAAKLRSDQNKVLDDQRNYLDSLDKIKEEQKKLNDLQGPAGALTLSLAINKLKDAQLSLVSSTKKASDAQWYLTYLQQEGASQRDITDAQDALNQANQGVADATDAVAVAQQNLKDVQDSLDPDAIAKAERDLADARRSSADALEKLHQDEQQVKQDRDDIAKDTAYKDALDKLKLAQYDLADATLKVHDEQAKLDAAKNGASAADELARATLNLEQALYRQATANVEVQKQTALSNGETFTAQQEAQALEQNLRTLGATAGGPVRANLQAMADVIEKHIKDKTVTISADTSKAVQGINDFSRAAGLAIDNIDAKANSHRGFLATIAAFFQGIGTGVWDFLTGVIDSIINIPTSMAAGGIFGAEGGIINSPRVVYSGTDSRVVAGEAGAEALIPLDGFYQRVLDPINQLSAQMAYNNSILERSALGDGAGKGNNNVSKEYHIPLTFNTNASASDISEELAWTLAKVG